jgi:hypothetical protein
MPTAVQRRCGPITTGSCFRELNEDDIVHICSFLGHQDLCAAMLAIREIAVSHLDVLVNHLFPDVSRASEPQRWRTVLRVIAWLTPAVLKPQMARLAAELLKFILAAVCGAERPGNPEAWAVLSTMQQFQASMSGFLREIAKLEQAGLAAALNEQVVKMAGFSDPAFGNLSRVGLLFDVIAKLPKRAIEPLAPLIIAGLERHWDAYEPAMKAFLSMGKAALALQSAELVGKKETASRAQTDAAVIAIAASGPDSIEPHLPLLIEALDDCPRLLGAHVLKGLRKLKPGALGSHEAALAAMVHKRNVYALNALGLIKEHFAPVPVAAALAVIVQDGGLWMSLAVNILSKLPTAALSAHVDIIFNRLSLSWVSTRQTDATAVQVLLELLDKAVRNVALTTHAEAAVLETVRQRSKFARARLLRAIATLNPPALQAFLPLLLEWKDREGLKGEDVGAVAAAKRAYQKLEHVR